MNPLWKVYKSKVLRSLTPDQEEEEVEEEEACEEIIEMQNDVGSPQNDEHPITVSQLARRVQGASVRGWNRLSALFNKEDEHQLLEETESPPLADHPLAVRPEEPSRTSRRTGFWDVFAANWAAKKQADAAMVAAAVNEAGPGEEGVEEEEGVEGGGEMNQDGENPDEGEGGGGGGGGGHSFSRYVTLGGSKWNFVTSKLAELKTKSSTKTN